MIVLVANCWSAGAEALARRWSAYDACILTPADLCASGWSQRLAEPGEGIAVIAGRCVPQREIGAVLSLMQCLYEEELTSVVPEDRAYVASEMTAFLLAWLTHVPCRVLNRPKPPGLCGPFWRPERWVRLAALAGIPVRSLRRTANPCDHGPVPPETLDSIAVVTVIGLATFGKADVTLHRHARVLARSAGVDLLEVQFSGPGADALLLAAQAIPDLSSPELADATLALLRTAAHA